MEEKIASLAGGVARDYELMAEAYFEKGDYAEALLFAALGGVCLADSGG